MPDRPGDNLSHLMVDDPTTHNLSRAVLERGTRIKELEADNRALRECLEGMVWQFGHVFARDGERWISTMGLSNLEWAFQVLGWDDPHHYPYPFLADER